MKRCPQCEFIYPDRDELCDFDQTPLVSVTEAEIAAITNTPERPALADLAATHSRKFDRRRSQRTLPIAAALGLLLSFISVAIYFAVHRYMASQRSGVVKSQAADSRNFAVPSPSPSTTIENAPLLESVVAEEKAPTTTSKVSTAHPTARVGPVSNGPPRTESESSSKSVILLTTGGRIEADAAWRTKDGVWYRRNGMVTLLKGNRVKAIVSQ